jgi:hypothetical protein
MNTAKKKPEKVRDVVDVLVIAALVFTLLKATETLFQLTHPHL